MGIFLRTIKKKYFLLLLTLVIGLIGILPLIIKPATPFYTFDPDPAYVANALEFLQIHKIFFVDHPGTPMIIFLSLIFVPIKVFESVMHISPFAFWAVQHFDLFMWVARFSVFAVFLTGIYIFQITFYKLFKSFLVNLFISAVLYLVPMYYSFQGVITPENFGLFFTSIWFYFVAKYINSEKIDFLVMASVFSGLAAASKLVFIFVFVSTLIISLYQKSIKKSFLVLSSFVAAFVLGTLPVLTKREAFNRWVSYLFTRESEFKVSQIVGANWFGTNYIFLVLIAVLGFVVFAKKEMKVYGAIFLSAFIGLFAFAKYSDLHYQYANFLLIALCMTAAFAQLRKKEMILALILLAFFSIGQLKHDFISKKTGIEESANLQKYADSLPKNGFYIWDMVESKEYSLIRGKEWSNWFYLSELKLYNPNLWSLYQSNMGAIVNNDGQRYSIDDFCWDGLFLDKNHLTEFLESQKDSENYHVKEIPGTYVLFVTQINCTNVPHPRELHI